MVAESLSPLDRVWLCRLERWQVHLTAGRFYAKLVDASRKSPPPDLAAGANF
jgi:hypothetical protein